MDTGEEISGLKTGKNFTKISGDKLEVSDEQAQRTREKQRDYTTKMSGVTGLDLTNPPSVKAAKDYFQTMAKNGASTDQIQKEYQQYLETFYAHPGGVNWNGDREHAGKAGPEEAGRELRRSADRQGRSPADRLRRLLRTHGEHPRRPEAERKADVRDQTRRQPRPRPHGRVPARSGSAEGLRGGQPHHAATSTRSRSPSATIKSGGRDTKKEFLLRTHLKEKHPAIRGSYRYSDEFLNMEAVRE